MPSNAEHVKKYRNSPRGREVKQAGRKRHRQRKRDFLNSVKDVPCADCGIKYPPGVMDLHHLDPLKKEVDRGLALYSWSVIHKELENCVVLCANCHRMRHLA